MTIRDTIRNMDQEQILAALNVKCYRDACEILLETQMTEVAEKRHDTKELTVTELHDIINKFLKKWKDILFLGMWKINFNLRDYVSDENGNGGCNANVFPDWRYFEATINFSILKLKDKDEKDIEEIVIHELCHIIVNEMQYDGMAHEERVVSHLSMIMSWMDNARP